MTYAQPSFISLIDAYLHLVNMTQQGFPFSARQVLHFDHPEEIRGTGEEQVGNGFHLVRQIPLAGPLAGQGMAMAQLQILRLDCFLPHRLFVRVDVHWRLPHLGSKHLANATLCMGVDDAERAILYASTDHPVDGMMFSLDEPLTIDGFLANQYQNFGITWFEEHLDCRGQLLDPLPFLPTIRAMRAENLGLLSLLSDSYVGAFNPDTLLNLYDWLRNQPETGRHLPNPPKINRQR